MLLLPNKLKTCSDLVPQLEPKELKVPNFLFTRKAELDLEGRLNVIHSGNGHTLSLTTGKTDILFDGKRKSIDNFTTWIRLLGAQVKRLATGSTMIYRSERHDHMIIHNDRLITYHRRGGYVTVDSAYGTVTTKHGDKEPMVAKQRLTGVSGQLVLFNILKTLS